VSSAVCAKKYDAQFLEARVIAVLRPHDLWNKGGQAKEYLVVAL
jgi:hypothetical protein